MARFLRRYFADTSAREMVELLNGGAAPDSPEAKKLVWTSGQMRKLVWLFVSSLILGASLCVWFGPVMADDLAATLKTFTETSEYFFLKFVIGCFLTGFFSISAVFTYLAFDEFLAGKGPFHWGRLLNSKPADCKELLDLDSVLAGGAVHALDRPLCIADLAYARELNAKRLRLASARRRREVQKARAAECAERDSELAAACSRVHGLVKTTMAPSN